jgi:hypothetical protein
MQRKLAAILTALLVALMLGCGSGQSASQAHSSKALTKVKTSGLLADGESIGAIMLRISIPLGVTVPLDPVTHEPASGVVSLTGAADSALVFQHVGYSAPTATAPGELYFIVVNAQGFGPVESINVQLDITPGYAPVAGDFTITNFSVAGLTNYSETAVVNPTVSVEMH